LVGGGSAGVSLLAELPSAEIEPYIEQQRELLAAQRATLMRPFARFFKS
jgi:DNA-binding IclR family transcriptional regulator